MAKCVCDDAKRCAWWAGDASGRKREGRAMVATDVFYKPDRQHGLADDLLPVEFERRYALSGPSMKLWPVQLAILRSGKLNPPSARAAPCGPWRQSARVPQSSAR
ncbi:hypothetical protein BVI2075_40042 [Burkholderia vietnamiensis]|nr:hypothetical protein BVI2075_40042 [Burkholderia vietnamiensis]